MSKRQRRIQKFKEAEKQGYNHEVDSLEYKGLLFLFSPSLTILVKECNGRPSIRIGDIGCMSSSGDMTWQELAASLVYSASQDHSCYQSVKDAIVGMTVSEI